MAEIAGGTGEGTDFLYPFIEAQERDAGPLLVDLGQSAVAKGMASAMLRESTLQQSGEEIAGLAARMTAAFAGGARLFTFGNGGSSTDAASLASLFSRPPWGQALPARCLVEDTAIVTALGNDVGFELVFSRQLIAHAASGDIALGFSTSGSSRNILTAFTQARAHGLVTVGLAGYDGGEMAGSPAVEHCLVVHSDSVHRVQETQAALGFALWVAIQHRLERRHG